MRYGRLGADAFAVSMHLGIGNGTVHLYCRRVSKAMRQLKRRFVRWDDGEVSERIQHRTGFPKCSGSGDGSLIRFTEMPIIFGPSYMTRKKFFGVSAF